jgi:hypothetical protein
MRAVLFRSDDTAANPAPADCRPPPEVSTKAELVAAVRAA